MLNATSWLPHQDRIRQLLSVSFQHQVPRPVRNVQRTVSAKPYILQPQV